MKKILTAIFVLIVAAGAYYFYNRIKTVEDEGSLTLYGNVDIRDVALGFRVSGRIAKMHFEEGDRVKINDIVATLDKKPFLDDLALTQAELDEARAAATNALRIYNRRVELVKTGAVSQGQYEDALANKNATMARKVRAEARLDLIKTRLDDTDIHAPADGIILTRVREPGAIVSIGANVYTLALSKPLWVRTYIDEPALGYIYPGQPVTIRTDSGGEYKGQIGFISPQAEFTPKNVETTQLRTDLVYRLRVIVNNPDRGLRQGMPVTVNIEQDKKSDGNDV